MSRLWSILLLLAVLGTAAWWCSNARPLDIGPMPSTPANPGEPSAPAPAHGDAPAPAPTEGGEVASRVDAELGPKTAAAATVQVRVEELRAGPPRRLANVEVVLRTDGAVLTARTDARGEAEFTCRGGDGKAATVWCALGAETTVAMAAAAPVPAVLTIRPVIVVRGRVLDAANVGVPRASIVLLPWDGFDGDVPAPWRIGASDANGDYEVGLAVGGRLGAQHSVFGCSPMYFVQRPSPASGEATSLTLPLVLLALGGQVTGIVRGADGRPVADAELEFRSANRAPRDAELAAVPQRARTDAHGTYTVGRLLPGTVGYGVRARGHGPREGTLTLAAGSATRCDLELPPACALVGSVRLRDGAAVDAAVTAGKPGAFTARTTRTAADGTFRLDDLAPGDTALAARAVRARTGIAASRVTATRNLRPDGSNVWEAVLDDDDAAAQANLRGTLLDAGGRPLPGWLVVTHANGTTPVSTATQADGAFALHVDARRVDLRAYAPGHARSGFADAVRRDLEPAGGPVQFVVPSEPRARLTARVVTEQGLALPATVRCWHHERGEYVSWQAGDDGAVARDDVPPGTIDLVFEHRGRASAPRRELAVTPPEPVDLGDVVLGAGGTLYGTVLGPGEIAADACELTILVREAKGTQRLVATAVGGAYQFAGVPAGNHSLLVQAPGLAGARFAVTVEAGIEKKQDLHLEYGVRRRLCVVVPAKAPRVLGVLLGVPGQPEATWMTSAAVPGGLDAVAEVRFDAFLPPGTYEAVAWAGRSHETHASVTFVAGDDSEIRIPLGPK